MVSEGIDDTRMDLSQLDENSGTGRSVPSTPLQSSPQGIFLEFFSITSFDFLFFWHSTEVFGVQGMQRKFLTKTKSAWKRGTSLNFFFNICSVENVIYILWASNCIVRVYRECDTVTQAWRLNSTYFVSFTKYILYYLFETKVCKFHAFNFPIRQMSRELKLVKVSRTVSRSMMTWPVIQIKFSSNLLKIF